MSTLVSHLPEIQDIVMRYGIRTLIETGVGEPKGFASGGLAVAELLGLRGLSCDIDEGSVEAARTRFPEAVVYHGTSTAFLEKMLPLAHGPCFVWLDAHFPGDASVPMWPVWDDLALLRGYERHVIWCDDMQHVRDPENPACKGQRVGVDGWPSDTAHTIAEYKACLADTHVAAIVGTVLRFTPKDRD
jgi:hypothetical protein